MFTLVQVTKSKLGFRKTVVVPCVLCSEQSQDINPWVVNCSLGLKREYVSIPNALRMYELLLVVGRGILPS